MNGLSRVIAVWLITTIAVAITVTLLPGISFTPSDIKVNAPGILGSAVLFPTLIFSAVLALFNAFIRPIVKFITLPITILTLGLFAIVLNVLMFYFVSWISYAFFAVNLQIANFWIALIASLLIGLVTAILSGITGVDSSHKKQSKQKQQNRR